MTPSERARREDSRGQLVIRLAWVATLAIAATALVIPAAACSKGSSAPSAASANAAVPEPWRDKIEFATTTQVVPGGQTFSVATPKGWRRWDAPTFALEPPDAQGVHVSPIFGQMVQMGLFANCDHLHPRDGNASAAGADRTRFSAYYRNASVTVVKDERQATRRVLIARDERARDTLNGPKFVSVQVVWWKPGPSECYWGCYAELAVASADLAPAFEQACLSARVE